MGLVNYASDSDTEAQAGSSKLEHRPVKKRKTLPSVPTNYVVDPKDDPTLHQGRSRSRPYVPGELNAHIYLSLKAPRGLLNAVGELIKYAQDKVPAYSLHSLLETPTPSQKAGELHISITHPLPLRRDQVESLRIDLTTALQNWSRTRGIRDFKCSLAGSPTVYYNGKATGGEGGGGRAFLALRVGAGSTELNSIVDKVVHPILEKYHLPLYHTNPEYHASFAWCLLDPATPAQADIVTDADGAVDVEHESQVASTEEPPERKTPLPQDLVEDLGRVFGKQVLAKQPDGGWEISDLILRAGKVLHCIPLA